MGDEVRPFAVSVHRPAPEADRAGSFNMGGAEGPDEFALSDADAAALEVRRNASTPKPQPTPEERDQLVHECYDAIKAQPWGTDALVRALAERLGVGVAEAERLLDGEVARRAARDR